MSVSSEQAANDEKHRAEDINEKIVEQQHPHRDPEILAALYHGRGLSLAEVGQELGVAESTIRYQCAKHDIPTRDRGGQRKETATYFVTPEGYGMWTCGRGGKTVGVYVHQLVAIAEGVPPERVFAKGSEVHHRTCHNALNIGSLLNVLSQTEHLRTHAEGDWTEERGFPVLQTQRDGD